MVKSISHTDILDQKLKSCDPHIKKFALKLESYIAKLESENARLKVNNMALNLRIKALETEIKNNINLGPTTVELSSNIRKEITDEAIRLVKESES
jgi:hypothetical protein